MARFQGLDRAYGRFVPAPPEEGKKTKGIATTVSDRGPSLQLWEEHLAGRDGLGIIPINDAATVHFAAADIDEYSLDLKHLAAEVYRLKLPLTLCRTKSGGAHLYLFGKEALSAKTAVGRMMEWAALLGYSGCEIFPKQTKLAGANDVGNWINMPYHGGERSLRYGISFEGKALTPEEFLVYAEHMAVTQAELEAFTTEDADPAFLDGPPCLQTLAQRGFPEGSRNLSMFSIGVYLQKRYGQGWEAHMAEYNERFMLPPMTDKDVTGVAKSLGKKNYGFKCRDHPIAPVCNRQLCLTRKFGIGQVEDDPGVVFGPLVKLLTRPPAWIWSVNGENIEMTTFELMDQNRAHARIIEGLNVWPGTVKPKTWQKLVQEKLGVVTTEEAPPDAGVEGQWQYHLHQFCTTNVAGAIDEVMMERPFTADGKTYFRSADFINYLRRKGINRVDPKELYQWLRSIEGAHTFKNLKGKGVNLWVVDAFSEQTEPFDPPVDTEAHQP